MSDAEQTDLSNWLHDPITQSVLEKVKAGLKKAALERLLSACRSSTDPKVAGALARYEAALNLEWLFSKGELKE